MILLIVVELFRLHIISLSVLGSKNCKTLVIGLHAYTCRKLNFLLHICFSSFSLSKDSKFDRSN